MHAHTYSGDLHLESLEDLESAFETAHEPPYGALNLTTSEKRALNLYWNDDVAALFFFDGEDDEVGSVANAPFELDSPDLVSFKIENGQVDEYRGIVGCCVLVA